VSNGFSNQVEKKEDVQAPAQEASQEDSLAKDSQIRSISWD